MLAMGRIIWSWQCCRILVGNIVNGIASKSFFAFLTELGIFKQNFFWRQCHWQCCQSKVCSIGKSRWFRPLYVYMRVEANYTLKLSIKSCTTKLLVIESVGTMSEQCRNGVGTMSKWCRNDVETMSKRCQNNVKTMSKILHYLIA